MNSKAFEEKAAFKKIHPAPYPHFKFILTRTANKYANILCPSIWVELVQTPDPAQ